MGKFLKNFDAHSEYQTYINGQDAILPNVSYCRDNNEVHYNPWVETKVIAKFNVTSTSEATQIINNYATPDYIFSEIEIDGVVQPSVVNSYTFDTTGEHTVKYTLVDPTLFLGFGYCTNLISISIPNSVTTIDESALELCTNLTSVTMSNNVTSIGSDAFLSCESLTNITIPDSVTTIGMAAFAGCTGLTSINIPNSVTSIGDSAFDGCSFTSITIPSSVTSIGFSPFLSCSGLTSITVDSNNPNYDSRNNCNAIIETSTNALIQGCQNTIIPNSVTTIRMSAFCGCTDITSITIPSGVTSIGSVAFKNCTGLTSINCLATTAPTITANTFWNIKTGGTLTVPTGSTGYNTWMGTGNYYLGKYSWTKVEQ